MHLVHTSSHFIFLNLRSHLCDDNDENSFTERVVGDGYCIARSQVKIYSSRRTERDGGRRWGAEIDKKGTASLGL